MNPRLKALFLYAVLVAVAVGAPTAGFAIGVVVIVWLGLTGVPATIVVAITIVATMGRCANAALWLDDHARRRT